MTTKKAEPMNPYVAVFNCHINNAKSKADKAFIKRFDKDVFNKEIKPFLDKGIMSIFKQAPNDYTKVYVEFIALYVNESKKPKTNKTSK